MLCIGMIAFAAGPNLAIESVFDGRYNNNAHTNVLLTKNKGKYTRMLTVTNDKNILDKVEELIKKDLDKAYSQSIANNNNDICYVLKIKSNGQIIKVVFTSNSRNGSLIIEGPIDAFQ